MYVARVRDVDALARGREAVGRRAWTDAHRALSEADAIAPLGAADLELLATAAYMLGRDEEFLDRPRARTPRAPRRRRRAACRALRLLVGDEPLHARREGPRDGMARPRPAARRARGADCVERGYLLMPVVFRHEAQGEPEAAAAIAADAAAVGERFGDRDLFGLAVHAQGRAPRSGEPDRRRASRCWTRRWWRSRRGAVADRQRHRLLRRHPRLSARLRRASRPGVDGGADALVRQPARHGRLHRPVPGAPRGDPAAAGRRGPPRSTRRGGPATAAAQSANRAAVGARRTCRARSIACGASSTRPRRPIGRRTGAAASRSPASRCCGWRRATRDAAARRDPPGAGRDHRRRRPRRGCCRPTSRSCSPPATSRRRAAPATSSTRSRRARSDMLGAMAAQARGRSISPTAMPAPRCRAAHAAAALAGARRAVRGGARARADRWACEALGDDDAAALDSRRRATPSPARGAPDVPAEARRAGDARA